MSLSIFGSSSETGPARYTLYWISISYPSSSLRDSYPGYPVFIPFLTFELDRLFQSMSSCLALHRNQHRLDRDGIKDLKRQCYNSDGQSEHRVVRDNSKTSPATELSTVSNLRSTRNLDIFVADRSQYKESSICQTC